MRMLNGVNILIILLLVMTACAAMNLQGTIDALDWVYDGGVWLLRKVVLTL